MGVFVEVDGDVHKDTVKKVQRFGRLVAKLSLAIDAIGEVVESWRGIWYNIKYENFGSGVGAGDGRGRFVGRESSGGGSGDG